MEVLNYVKEHIEQNKKMGGKKFFQIIVSMICF